MVGRGPVLQPRKGAGPSKGTGRRPLGPSSTGSLNTRAEGQGGPAITHPTTGAKVLQVSPGVYLQVFNLGQVTQPPWASVSPSVKRAGSQRLLQVLDTRWGCRACLLSRSTCQAEPGPDTGRDRKRHSACLPDTSRCQGLRGGPPLGGAMGQDPAIRLLLPFCGE